MTELVFPSLPGEAFPVKMKSRWSTTPFKARSGRQYVEDHWAYPVRTFNMTYNFLREGFGYSEMQALAGFFDQMHGRAKTFLYRPVEYQAAVDHPMGLSISGITTYAMTYTVFGNLEPVGYVLGNPTIKLDGVVQTGGFSVQEGRVIVFSAPPPSGRLITWSGAWYLRCRFTDDEMDYQKFADGIFSAAGVEFETDKL